MFLPPGRPSQKFGRAPQGKNKKYQHAAGKRRERSAAGSMTGEGAVALGRGGAWRDPCKRSDQSFSAAGWPLAAQPRRACSAKRKRELGGAAWIAIEPENPAKRDCGRSQANAKHLTVAEKKGGIPHPLRFWNPSRV